MRTLKYLTTAAMAAALAFASCTKEIEAPEETGQEEESYSRETGAPVVFGVSIKKDNNQDTKAEYSEELFTSIGGKLQKIGEVSTGYYSEAEAPDTKVEYSGETFIENQRKYERIDWELNDRISIVCPQALRNNTAEYKIHSITSNMDHHSMATIKSVGEGLKWSEEEVYFFYGIYPKIGGVKKAGHNKVISCKPNYNSFRTKTEIPENQTYGNKPIMVALTKVNKSANLPFTLNFMPEVQTFDITIINGRQNSVNLSSIELWSPTSHLSGEQILYLYPALQNSSSGYDTGFIRNNSVKHIYENGKTLAPNESCSVRLYTFPHRIYELVLILRLGDEIINLELKRSDGKWRPFYERRKHTLKNIRIPDSVTDYSYTFEVSPIDTILFAPLVPYTMSGNSYFKLNDPLNKEKITVKSYRTYLTNRLPVEWGSFDDVEWLGVGAHGSGDASGAEQNVVVTSNGLYKGNHTNPEKEQERLRRVNRMNFYTANNEDLSIQNGIRNTANCYIIKKDGTYKFPLVYGNAIKNGRPNPDAYTPIPRPEGVSQAEWLTEFKDGTGATITSPNITNAVSVELIWYYPQYAFPEDLSLEQGQDGLTYACFRTRSLSFGHYLFAVKNAEGTIIWTWTIWVTDISTNTNSGEFLSEPLGYALSGGGYNEYNNILTLNQFEAKGKSKSIPIKIKKVYDYKSALYYTFGRITPSIQSESGYYKHENKRLTYPAQQFRKGNPYHQKFRYKADTDSLASMISSPGTIRQLRNKYRNIWDQNPYGATPVKTVYDPCPPRYRVPTANELNIANLSGIKLGRLSRPFQVSVLKTHIKDYAEKAYFLHTSGYRVYPEQTGESIDFLYMPILPIKE